MKTFREFMVESIKIAEEAPATSAGAGNIAGIGVGEDGEPGVSKKDQKKRQKKKKKDAVLSSKYR